MTTTSASLSLFSRLRTLRNSETAVKEVSFKKRNGYIGDYAPTGLKFNLNGLFLRVVQLSRPAVCIHSLKRRPHTRCGEKKGGTRRQYSQSFGWGGPSWLAHTRGLGELFSPPRHCVSMRGHPAGFNGDTRRAAVLRRRWTRCVKFSWGESPLYNRRQHNTAALLTLGLLKRTGRETFF